MAIADYTYMRCIASPIVYIEFAVHPSGICGREIENEEKKLTLSEYIRRKERKMPLRLLILFANFYRGRLRELCVCVVCDAKRKGGRKRERQRRA